MERKWALCAFRRSWDSVMPETISRCFRKAGFVINPDLDGVINDLAPENEEEELNHLWDVLQENGEVEGQLADYLAVDQEVVTGGALTMDEIVAACSRIRFRAPIF
jgi:hypothetical protein